jgi:hypothetical protein
VIPDMPTIIRMLCNGECSPMQALGWLVQLEEDPMKNNGDDRSMFAGMAMQGLCSTGDVWPRDDDGPLMARKAVAYADALVAELARKTSEASK